MPKGTIAEQRDGRTDISRPAAVLTSFPSRQVQNRNEPSQPSHCSPRGLTTSACIDDREPRASGFRLSTHPQSPVEVRWPVQPGPILSSESLAYAHRLRPADPVFPSRGVPMATPVFRRIAWPLQRWESEGGWSVMPTPLLARRQLAEHGGQPYPCSPCHWHLGPSHPTCRR